MARKLPTGSEYESLREVEFSNLPAGNGVPREDRVFRASTILWQHRSFLGAVLLRSALLVALVALLLPATYESKTELMPPDQQSGAAGMLSALMGAGSSTGSLTSSGPGMTCS